MSNLILFDPTDQPISAGAVLAVFQSVVGFSDIRRNTPSGTQVEAEFHDGDDYTTARLSEKGDQISLSDTSDAAFQAALILQSHLKTPLRIIDTEYTFDLILSDYTALEELNAAIDEVRAKGI